MRFFLDENIPKVVAELLVRHGHEVDDIRGTASEGADDASIFRMAQDRGAIFLTTDRDFYHTIPHAEKEHHGVIVVALHQPNRQNILKRIEWFLNRFQGADLRNRVFELRDKTYVISLASLQDS